MKTWRWVMVVGALAIYVWPLAATAQPAIEPALILDRAEVEQHPPFLSTGITARPITIRFVVAGEPSCASERRPTYALLTDAFPWRRTHVSLPEFPELRFQRAIAIRCDATGRLAANVAGLVVVERLPQPAGGVAIVLRTTLDQLPAVEFRWIAVASNGTDYTRAPKAGKYARWTIYERTLR